MISLRPHTGLQIAGVSHRFGSIVAADDVHLTVGPGQVHCLLGPSGSGKSTLLRLIAGLAKLQRGMIVIDGEPVAGDRIHRAPERRAVGFVFQDYALFPHLDARGNVAFGMTDGRRADKLWRADAWLEKVGLSSHTRAMPHTLSGGQQQRVALARALARSPAVMLLDEPFSGLDRSLRTSVRDMTLRLLRESYVATLLITHDPREALLSGDRVSVIREGRVLQTGTPDEVFRRSTSRAVAEIFGPVNTWRTRAVAGFAATPWGDLPARAADDSPLEGPVEVLIRPDTLRLARPGAEAAIDPAPASAPGPAPRIATGTVVAVRTAGALTTAHVTVRDQTRGTSTREREPVPLEVLDFAHRGWRAGDAVHLTLGDEVAVIPIETDT